MSDLMTRRLHLVPFKGEIVQAAMMSNAELAKILGVKILPDWPDEEFIQGLPEIAEVLSKNSWQGEWGWGNLVIQKVENILIGHVMIKIIREAPELESSPTGSLEIGYQIAPSYRQQGYGSEATKAIIDWLFCQPSVHTITAGCDADNIASKRLLEKVGMLHTETRCEGKILVWKLSRPS